MMFGPSDDNSPNSAQSMQWKIKLFSNDALRQKFVDNTVPQVLQLGLTVPDPDLRFNEATGHYQSGEINWDEFLTFLQVKAHVITNVSKHAVKRGKVANGYVILLWSMHKKSNNKLLPKLLSSAF